MYSRVFLHLCMCVACFSMVWCAFVCMFVRMFISIFLCMYACMYVCMYVCMLHLCCMF